MIKTYKYKGHQIQIHGFDEDDDGVSQVDEVYVDGERAHIENGPMKEMIERYIDSKGLTINPHERII